MSDASLASYLATAQHAHHAARQRIDWYWVVLWRRQTNYLTTRLEERE